MKAKTYYIDPESLNSPSRLTALEPQENMADDLKVFILLASSLDKVIERAAKALHAMQNDRYRACNISTVTWRQLAAECKTDYRNRARAAYQAGGFCP